MLYRDNLEVFNIEKEEFIFDAIPYNEDIDIKDIAVLENFLNNNGYIPDKYMNMFLNYIIYYSRINCVSNNIESPLTSSLKGKCAIAAHINYELLKKFNLKVNEFNIGNVFGDYLIHQLALVEIPTMINGEIKNKQYLLDPTFRQFCIAEENRFERYYEEPRFSVNMSTPHPGYFLNLNDKTRNFAKDLIHLGYFEISDENIKMYCDAFALYLTPKEDYENKDLIGRIFSTNISGSEYLQKIINSFKKGSIKSGKEILTPLESITLERKKLMNKLKYFITKKDEFESNLIIEENTSKMKK